MTDGEFDISRRKALAALGTIGVASAGAGLGTSAYFSDQETFENNRLVAGELDLKMDWEEHYSDWSADENDNPDDGSLDIRMEEPENSGDYTRYPAGVEDETEGLHSLWVANGDVPQFQDNTAIEAFPDDDDDGIASYGDLVDNNASDEGFPGNDENDLSPTACDILADVGDDDGGLSSDSRTNATIDGQTTSPGDPLINLQDVKPGDFGEVTFSTHLCDNDGYLWMNAPGGLTADETGTTEPEADDPEEGEGVELVDTVQTALWYDNNCDNVPQEDPEPVDVIAIADTSASISDEDPDNQLELLTQGANAFVEELPNGTLPSGSRAGEEIVRIGLMSFAGGEDIDTPVSLEATVGPVDQFLDGDGNGIAGDFLPDETAGNTPMAGALDIARGILNDPSLDGVRESDVDKKILLVTDGAPNYSYGIIETGLPNAGEEGVQYGVDYNGTSIYSEKFVEGIHPENDDGDGGTPGLGNDPFEGSDDFPDGGEESTSSDQERYETWQIASEGSDYGFTAINGDTTNDDDGMEILVAGIANEDVGLGDALDSYLQMRIASTPSQFYDTNFSADIRDTARQIARDVAAGGAGGEEYIFRGETLADAIDRLSDGNGIPLDGDRTTEGRQCFDASATHCFGFSWWVPIDHGNEIQSDAASFDIGFYTEQCRHNDGSGMNNEEVTPAETDA
ncbi:vWA domain-containing protein [Haloplanus salinarum]|uniref:vWA domain-containing protein n=1 Tax=Haloplanus salinarum TaxID=1912324 RepID=UPI00214CEB0F|nr:vWA domain-containing protein [Haloplanus salinarum]